MKTILKISIVAIALSSMLFADLPFLPVQAVPEAQAIFGVWRRHARRWAVVGTAAVATTAAATTAAATSAAAASETAAAQQQAAAAQQQAAPALPGHFPDCVRRAARYLCAAAASFPRSHRVAFPRRSAEWSTTTAAATSIERCSRGTNWFM